MSTAQHTPGPWVAAEILMHQRFIEIIHRDQRAGAASTVIARVTYRPSWAQEQYANARLIAAAPTMLDALQDALCSLEISGQSDYVTGRVRAAIAEATGAAP